MRIKILNLLIALAILLNVWTGWKLGTLYGPHAGLAPEQEQIYRKNTSLSYLPKTDTPISQMPCLQQKEFAELDRRILEVVEQLQRMQLPENTVLVIRTEGGTIGEADNLVMEAGFVKW